MCHMDPPFWETPMFENRSVHDQSKIGNFTKSWPLHVLVQSNTSWQLIYNFPCLTINARTPFWRIWSLYERAAYTSSIILNSKTQNYQHSKACPNHIRTVPKTSQNPVIPLLAILFQLPRRDVKTLRARKKKFRRVTDIPEWLSLIILSL